MTPTGVFVPSVTPLGWVVANLDYQDTIPEGRTAAIIAIIEPDDWDGCRTWFIMDHALNRAWVPAGSQVELPSLRQTESPPAREPEETGSQRTVVVLLAAIAILWTVAICVSV